MKRLFALFSVVALLFVACDLVVTPEPTPNTPAPELYVGVSGIITLEAQGGEFSIPYSITNPVEGVALEATTEQDWIGNITVSEVSVELFVDVNNSPEQRVGMVTLTYGQESITLAIEQAASEINSDIKFNVTSDRKMAFTSTKSSTDTSLTVMLPIQSCSVVASSATPSTGFVME